MIAARTAFGAKRQRRDRVAQVGNHRHRQLGGSGRGGRAQIGHKINQGGVGFMTNRRNHRNIGLGHRTGNDFLVKRPQIFKRSTTARNNQHIRARDLTIRQKIIKAPNGFGHLIRVKGNFLDEDTGISVYTSVEVAGDRWTGDDRGTATGRSFNSSSLSQSPYPS